MSDLFSPRRDGPRPLTAQEMRRLLRLGFPEIARRLLAGTCPRCGLNRLGYFHRTSCKPPPEAKPARAPAAAAQPWEPKPPRSREP